MLSDQSQRYQNQTMPLCPVGLLKGDAAEILTKC